MYKTILVPHAGTPAGDKALEHAIFIAKASSAKIILLHIVEQLQYPPTFALASSERENLLSSIKSATNTISKEMMEEMEKKKGICKKNNVQVETQVVVGNPSQEIIKIVNERNIDIVVMAKRRKLKGMKKLLSLGSVSRKIVENVKCPVFLIDIEN